MVISAMLCSKRVKHLFNAFRQTMQAMLRWISYSCSLNFYFTVVIFHLFRRPPIAVEIKVCNENIRKFLKLFADKIRQK